MGYTSIVGLQWGDEGKGRVVDYLSRDFFAVGRFQGGANAGHTVYLDKKSYVFHLMPTGLLREKVKGVIGAGVLIDPDVFLEEISWIEKRAGSLKERFFVDGRAHVVLPHHKEEDQWEEEKKGGIGTTKRGIGPAYRDLYARFGVRITELLGNNKNRALDRAITFNNQILGGRYGKPPISKENVLKKLNNFTEAISQFVANVPYLLADWDMGGKEILLEGAQGTLLDIFFGTYPFVTSSHTIGGGGAVGSGIPPHRIKKVIGVTKAYTTRVGGGPFPTELKGEEGNWIRERGKEYGATTGRPRRCGWLDLVALRYANLLNGTNEIVMTKLDVLSGLEKVKVCVFYKINEEKTQEFPMDSSQIGVVIPEYVELDGWDEDSVKEGIRGNALKYIKFVEDFLGIPVRYVSTGKEREEMVERPKEGWL